MTPEQGFQIVNTIALLSWLLLFIAPHWKWTSRITVGGVVSLLCIAYVFMAFRAFGGGSFDSFSSLEGVMALFTKKGAVLAGWIHYLAFDLMVGWYIITNAAKHHINRFVIIPCLLFTFMLGPSGLLLYWIFRALKARKVVLGYE